MATEFKTFGEWLRHRRLQLEISPFKMAETIGYKRVSAIYNFEYGIAPYWTAYDVSFRTQGRVHLASSEFVRIPEFQEQYDHHVREAVRIGGGPCAPFSTLAVGTTQLCVPR